MGADGQMQCHLRKFRRRSRSRQVVAKREPRAARMSSGPGARKSTFLPECLHECSNAEKRSGVATAHLRPPLASAHLHPIIRIPQYAGLRPRRQYCTAQFVVPPMAAMGIFCLRKVTPATSAVIALFKRRSNQRGPQAAYLAGNPGEATPGTTGLSEQRPRPESGRARVANCGEAAARSCFATRQLTS
jgi:hypothetical protein